MKQATTVKEDDRLIIVKDNPAALISYSQVCVRVLACVCTCTCVCVRPCTCVCMRACVWVRARVFVYGCMDMCG